VATAEITLGGLMAGQTIDADDLPIKFCGISHCFRTEAGAHGRAARGLFRVHQFTKVEMFAYTLPGESDDMLDYLRDLQCRIFDGLGVPFRVVDTATGDLGGPAYRKFDLEAWMPAAATSARSPAPPTARLSGPAIEHPLQDQGREGHPARPHTQRHGCGDQPRVDRRDGELPAGRRLDQGARGSPALGRQGADCGAGVRFSPLPSGEGQGVRVRAAGAWPLTLARHQEGTPGSAINASRIGGSTSSVFGPKVSR